MPVENLENKFSFRQKLIHLLNSLSVISKMIIHFAQLLSKPVNFQLLFVVLSLHLRSLPLEVCYLTPVVLIL